MSFGFIKDPLLLLYNIHIATMSLVYLYKISLKTVIEYTATSFSTYKRFTELLISIRTEIYADKYIDKP